MRQDLWLGLFISLIILLAGCSSQNIPPESAAPSEDVKAAQAPTLPKAQSLSTIEPSQMVLDVSDFPEGWVLQGRAERVKSDVSEKGLSRGWKKGYMASFLYQEEDNVFQFSRIDQFISVYPIENVASMVVENSDENVTYEELSDPRIGEGSKFYKVTEKTSGDTSYELIFNKKDVLMRLEVSGTIQDSELLKQLGKKAEAKIR